MDVDKEDRVTDRISSTVSMDFEGPKLMEALVTFK